MNRPWTSAVMMTVASCGWMACVAAAGEPRIEQVAPDSSVVVVSVKHCAATVERFKATKLWELWLAPELAETRAEMQKSYAEGLKKMMEELAVDEQSLPWPTGAVGFALFPVLDEELGTNEPAFIWFADYGAEADRAAALVDAMVKKSDEGGEVTVDEEDVLGRKVLTIKPKESPEAGREGPRRGGFERGGDEDGQMRHRMAAQPGGDDEPEAGPEALFGELGKVHYVRDGNVLMVSSDMRRLTRALESADGADSGGRSIADTREFQRMNAQLGEADGYAILMVDNLVAILSGPAMPAGMIMPIVKSIVGNITGIGVGMRINAEPAMVESTWVVHMPGGSSGITSLVDRATPRATPPSFVGPDTIGYAHVNFDFQRLPGVLRQIFTALAMFTGEDPEAMMAAIEPELTPVTSALGTDAHIASIAPPGGEGMAAGFYALRCQKPGDIQNYLAARAPMLQLQPRDFLGHTVYTMDLGGMAMPMMGGAASLSVAVGGEYVFLGVTSAVEQALRAIGAGGGGLADAAMFKQAAAALPDGPAVAWGFTNVVAQVEAARGMITSQFQAMKAMGMDANGPNVGLADPFESVISFMNKVDTRMLQRYIGPSSWQVTSTGDGYVGKSYLLPPVD